MYGFDKKGQCNCKHIYIYIVALKDFAMKKSLCLLVCLSGFCLQAMPTHKDQIVEQILLQKNATKLGIVSLLIPGKVNVERDCFTPVINQNDDEDECITPVINQEDDPERATVNDPR